MIDADSEVSAMSVGQLARQRSLSANTRPPLRSTTPLEPRHLDFDFEPCAATASIFLFTQDSSIICLHHDTLTVDRRFERHKERILFLSVDNFSERGAGRLVVSYDAGQTAIVWDLFTGDEIARFASFEPIRVAAWMKNGNVAFGTRERNWKSVMASADRPDRQLARERDPVRAVHLGAYFTADDFRSYYHLSSRGRLPNICDRVCDGRWWWLIQVADQGIAI